jgi:methylenetetrahydrofolate dehydrogenase (NADP+) / methenyltetrahydrofolate cyclohydrolase
MTARVLDGRSVSAQIGDEVHRRARALRDRGVAPAAVVFVAHGDAPGMVYAQSIARRGGHAAIDIRVAELDFAGPNAALEAVRHEAAAPGIHGVLIQRPLPPTVDPMPLLDAIPLAKDVDAANPRSLGLLVAGRPRFVPATAAAVMALLAGAAIDVAGMRVAVIGRSPVVGKPLALLLIAADATVTVCHTRTRDLQEICRASDAIVAALGRSHFVTPDFVRAGAVVVDVGTNIVDGKVVGDVHPEVAEVAGALSPVPGGVGPVTTAVFLRNVVEAAEAQSSSAS